MFDFSVHYKIRKLNLSGVSQLTSDWNQFQLYSIRRDSNYQTFFNVPTDFPGNSPQDDCQRTSVSL